MNRFRDDIDDLLPRVACYGQESVLRFWDELDPSQRRVLAQQIRSIDFARIAALAAPSSPAEQAARLRGLVERADPPPFFRLGGARNVLQRMANGPWAEPAFRSDIQPEQAQQAGQQAWRSGQFAVILVAGGLGTRLGFDQPKGMYPIGPISRKSLFQIHFEKIVALGRRYGVRVPVYLMTSPETHDKTVAFLDQHGRFGLPAEDLYVFCQGTMPAVDAATGKVLLAEKHRLALSPDGHGGMLAAFDRSGAMAHAATRGIRHLFYFQVDNPLVQVGHPEFLGYHLLSGSEYTSQVVRKRDPLERVGNVVAVDGRLHVIEYSDLPDEIARQRNPDGSLRIWAGSIAVHAFRLDFLQRMAPEADRLPFHLARKKVAYVDPSGRRVEPAQPNAIKFERFIFDLMPYAENAVVVEVDGAEHFAPLKNAPGSASDTPESVRAQMMALHRAWLRRAGVEVPDQVPVEISPLYALDAEELAARKDLPDRVIEPTYFG